MALLIEAERGAGDVIAALRVGKERFVPARDPLHRPAQPPRRPDDQRLLRVVLALVAEAAADVARDDAQVRLGDAELLADVAADMVRRLRSDVERVAGRRRAARLDRRAAQPVIHQLDFDLATRARHRLLHGLALAARPAEGPLTLDQRQGLVVHLHVFGKILGRDARLGEHHRHRLADVAHDLARQRPARRLVHSGQHPAAAHRLDVFDVLAREDDTGGGSDRPDAGMRMRRANENAVQLARKGQVADELAGTRQEALVLDAPQRGADHRTSSRSSSSRS